ncbi:MAG: molybdopterin-synthase adenylyltransferase MoeB [Hyphomicrobiales bacterium]|nr:molybdopterin-synthase adenylyltransferase MoeB [Hyphomicrobiales bacterium]
MDNSNKPQDPLSGSELERYARHIVLRDVGGSGQQKLKSARVLVIGAGGLGSPVLQYLTAAGVGTIGVIDDDIVSLSNLQRQLIHDTDKVGMLKTQSAASAMQRINPHTKVEQWPIRMNKRNAYALLSCYDVVADGSDNFDTRYLAAETCEILGVPLIYAAVGQFDGSVTALKPYQFDSEGNPLPALRDIFPVKPSPGTIPTCQEAGVMGVLTGIVGTIQAQEVIKEIVGFGESLTGRLLMIDAKTMRFETIAYKRAVH